MADTDAIVVFMTAANGEEATRLAEMLVGAHLAACVQILPEMESVYRWQGKIERQSEILLLAKTTREKFAELERASSRSQHRSRAERKGFYFVHAARELRRGRCSLCSRRGLRTATASRFPGRSCSLCSRRGLRTATASRFPGRDVLRGRRSLSGRR